MWDSGQVAKKWNQNPSFGEMMIKVEVWRNMENVGIMHECDNAFECCEFWLEIVIYGGGIGR